MMDKMSQTLTVLSNSIHHLGIIGERRHTGLAQFITYDFHLTRLAFQWNFDIFIPLSKH